MSKSKSQFWVWWHNDDGGISRTWEQCRESYNDKKGGNNKKCKSLGESLQLREDKLKERGKDPENYPVDMNVVHEAQSQPPSTLPEQATSSPTPEAQVMPLPQSLPSQVVVNTTMSEGSESVSDDEIAEVGSESDPREIALKTTASRCVTTAERPVR